HERREHLGGVLQAVALAAHGIQARPRRAQPLLRARAVAFLLLEIPVRAPHDRGTAREAEEEEDPCGPEGTQSLGFEDVLHAAPAGRRSRTMRSTKRGSIVSASRSPWRPCSAIVGLTSSGLSTTSARKPSSLPMSAARRSTSSTAPRKSLARTRTLPSTSATS